VVEHSGFEQAQDLLVRLLAGKIGPETGNILRL